MGALGTTKWTEALGLESKLEDDLASAKRDLQDIPNKEQSYNKDQVVELARNDLNMLAGLAISTMFRYLFPREFVAIWQLLLQLVHKTGDFSKVALGIPRGFAKTTVIKLFILYCILFTKKVFILVICSTEAHATNIIADVIDMLNENNIVRLFGSWKLGIEVDRQDLKKFGFRGRNIILAGIGAEGSIRGLNLKNERPDVMIFDDVQTAECAESKVQSETLERWMIGTAMKAKSPHGCLYLFAGNMYRTPYSILKKLKQNPTWVKFISGAILADGTSLWEELRPLKSLLEELDGDIAMGHPEIFFAEVLNDTEAGYNTKVDFALIKPWPWGEHELPQGKAIIIDPSSNKVGGDDVAMGYMEVYDGTPAMRDVIEENLSPGNTIRRALLLALRHNCKLIAVESNAYQYSLLYWFGVISEELGISGIQFVDVYSGSYSKNSRITDMLKLLTSGEIIIHQQIKSVVMHQISEWSPLRRNNVDNILDLLSYMPRVLELYGYAMATDTDMAVLEASQSGVVEDNHAF